MPSSGQIPAVIMAGGLGTRIASVDSSVPKPMLKVCGKPIMEYQIEALARQGVTNITVVTGHLGHIIRDHFGNGARYGADIRYFSEESPLGTAGALRYLDIAEDFLVTNGDLLFNIEIGGFYEAHRDSRALATILTHPNDHPYDSEIVVADSGGKITGWLPRDEDRGWYRNVINAGLHILSPQALAYLPGTGKANMDRDVLRPLIQTGRLYAYHTPQFVMDVGTPDRLAKAEQVVRAGWLNPAGRERKAVFLDRDGTVNKYVGFLRDIGDFVLQDGAAQGIRLLNQCGYLVIVVTNQPVIARGELDWDGLRQIHNKMETLLGREGAYVDDILVCPHHPDKGFAGERPEYKIDCDCRKPKPGLLLRAAEKFGIDLARSWMVGDSDRDIQAGRAAGCRTVSLGGDLAGASKSAVDLRKFAESILNTE